MARNRILYQSEGVFISQFANSTNVEEHVQLSRVQLANYSFSVNKRDVNQFGQLARIGSIDIDQPTVNFNTAYFLTDGFNDKAIGLSVGTGEATNLLQDLLSDQDGVNIYVVTAPEGFDLNNNTGLYPYVALGNAFLESYNLNLSVGAIPTVSTSFSAANILANTMTGVNIVDNPAYDLIGEAFGSIAILPAADPYTGAGTVSAIRRGDISFTISPSSGSISVLDFDTGIHLQSFDFALDLGFDAISQLGQRIAPAKAIQAPIVGTISMNAFLSEIQSFNLSEILNSSETFNLNVSFNHEGSGLYELNFNRAKLSQENFASSIGSNNKIVDLVFETQIGDHPLSTRASLTTNIWASGSAANNVYPYEAFLINNQEVSSSDGDLILVTV